jgi:hypothetical protein
VPHGAVAALGLATIVGGQRQHPQNKAYWSHVTTTRPMAQQNIYASARPTIVAGSQRA